MKSRLLPGTKGDERELLKQRFTHNKDLFNLVVNILKDDIDISLREMRDPENTTRGSYSEFVADQLGYQRALAKCIALLTLDQGD